MKCIKSIRASKGVEVGDIKRVDDKTAMNMVGLSWQYISKTEWKSSRGKKVVEETTEQVTAQTTEQVEKKPYKKGSKPEKKSK
jgi:hypothetical protein